jgi:hypothetical protein
MRPEVLAGLRDRMDRLQAEFEELPADRRISVADWVESICRPWIEARVPMGGSRLGRAWAPDLLLFLMADYDASGQVMETSDPGFVNPRRTPSSVATTTRLAAAAGWIAWSHLIVDTALSGAALTVLGELDDRIQSMADQTPDPFSPADRGWALVALSLERRLLRHWVTDRLDVH